MITDLCRLEPGQSCSVEDISVSGALEARLRDFGLIPGTQVTCRYYSPDKAVTALWMKGTVLALRRSDLTGIRVQLHG